MSDSSDIEKFYEIPDPWGYQANADDIARKELIINLLIAFGKFNKALDIACGEGWITTDLPAKKIYGIELSDKAASRFPENIKRIKSPRGKYDLIVCTGALYKQYDYKQLTDWILKHADNIVLTCNIKSWEINELPSEKQIAYHEFPYREFIQVLRIYKW